MTTYFWPKKMGPQQYYFLTPPGNPSSPKWALELLFGIFWCMYNFYIIFGKYCNFFQSFVTPGGHWGDCRDPGGAPPRGYPIWVPCRNSLNILRFWNILEWIFRHNKQKKRDRPNLETPPGLCTPPKHPPNWPGGPKVRVGPIFFPCYA